MEHDFWEQIDNADVMTYAGILDEIKTDLTERILQATEKAPEPVRENIHQVSEKLYSTMDQFRQAEMECGPSCETWKNYGPQHEIIKDDLKNLRKVQEKSIDDPALLQAAKQAEKSFEAGSEYFKRERDFLLQRNKQFCQELQQIQDVVSQMQGRLAFEYNPEEMKRCAVLGAAMLASVKQIQQESKIERPIISEKMLKEAREQVTKVCTEIRHTPEKVKAAVQDKAYRTIDAITSKVGNAFDKTIQYLEGKKQEFLNLSPLEKARAKEKLEAKQAERPEPARHRFNLRVEPKKTQSRGRELER